MMKSPLVVAAAMTWVAVLMSPAQILRAADLASAGTAEASVADAGDLDGHGSSLAEVVVNARRRAENAQDVPYRSRRSPGVRSRRVGSTGLRT